jgi:hypothetical protein
MPVPWKARKTKYRFPSLPTAPWTTRKHREFPTFPPPGFDPDGKVENQKQVSHFPTVPRDDDSCFTHSGSKKAMSVDHWKSFHVSVTLRSRGLKRGPNFSAVLSR